MPYISQEYRKFVDSPGDVEDFWWPARPVQNGGELNYAISKLCAEYVLNNGLAYQVLSDVVGALEGAKQEFVRQIVNPYEDKKILENGPLEAYQTIRGMI